MRARILQLIFILLSFNAYWSTADGSQEIPALQGRVNDYANMLSSATVTQLNEVLRSLEETETSQIAVLTVTTLHGSTIEEYSLRVVEKWKLGQKGLDNGALLLIAKNDRKIRIEVGYGLEGVLTDLGAGRIIREIITPHFKSGNFNQGVIDGVGAMVASVKGEFKAENFKKSGQSSIGDNMGGVLVFLIITIFNIGRFSGKRRIFSVVICAILVPVIFSLFQGFNWLFFTALIPVGGIIGYFSSYLFGSLTGSSRRVRGRSYHSRGGLGGGSFGGGFSGGGGGFGGGGSSGGW